MRRRLNGRRTRDGNLINTADVRGQGSPLEMLKASEAGRIGGGIDVFIFDMHRSLS